VRIGPARLLRNILGESPSVKGAMEKAPKDKSYALVRGEYTSDGR
jgi:hypothetical protein